MYQNNQIQSVEKYNHCLAYKESKSVYDILIEYLKPDRFMLNKYDFKKWNLFDREVWFQAPALLLNEDFF